MHAILSDLIIQLQSINYKRERGKRILGLCKEKLVFPIKSAEYWHQFFKRWAEKKNVLS